jgi:hypothetical protein
VSTPVSRASRVVVAPQQVSSMVEGEVVILDLERGVYYGLDEVGAWVWQSIQTPRTVADVHSALLEEFDVDADRGERDLLALLDDLAANSLIEVRE